MRKAIDTIVKNYPPEAKKVVKQYGWFEGFSEGYPESECKNRSAVPYGCWFYVLSNVKYGQRGSERYVREIINVHHSSIH